MRRYGRTMKSTTGFCAKHYPRNSKAWALCGPSVKCFSSMVDSKKPGCETYQSTASIVARSCRCNILPTSILSTTISGIGRWTCGARTIGTTCLKASMSGHGNSQGNTCGSGMHGSMSQLSMERGMTSRIWCAFRRIKGQTVQTMSGLGFEPVVVDPKQEMRRFQATEQCGVLRGRLTTM